MVTSAEAIAVADAKPSVDVAAAVASALPCMLSEREDAKESVAALESGSAPPCVEASACPKASAEPSPSTTVVDIVSEKTDCSPEASLPAALSAVDQTQCI